METLRIPVLVLALAALSAGCPTVDLGDDPPEPGACRPDPVFFETTIWPEYIVADAAAPARSCVIGQSGCHRRADGRSSFRIDFDEAAPDYDPQSYTVVTRFLNCGSPESSSLLTKPLSGIDSHGGGDLFEPGSEAEQVFLQWFQTP